MDRIRPTRRVLRQIPGWIAATLMIGVATFWTFWGFGEMYHEGWFGAWYNRLVYMAPVVLTLIPTLLAFTWPIAGGCVIVGIGVFALFFFSNDVAYIGLAVAAIGALFIWDGWIRRRAPPADGQDERPWWRRHMRYVIAIGLPAVVAVVMSSYNLPIVLTRFDDGDRGERLIEGNGVRLVWAPKGPGWSWVQDEGAYASWEDIALYGVAPVGFGDKPGYGRVGSSEDERIHASEHDMAATNLCRFVVPDGSTFADEPVDVWRMPTTDEVVRSLVHHGENAGCLWRDEYRTHVQCDLRPDKESPLWDTDESAVYYWTADSYSDNAGYFVAYNGAVNSALKHGGNPRHSSRCVREP